MSLRTSKYFLRWLYVNSFVYAYVDRKTAGKGSLFAIIMTDPP